MLCPDVSQGEVVVISPSSSCPMTSSVCISLDQLATNVRLFDSNTTIILLPGIHMLSTELSIFNISYLSLRAESSVEESSTVVLCQRNSGVNFNGINDIDMCGVKLVGCKCEVVFVKQATIENLTFHGKSDSGTALEIIATNAVITNSTFILNRIGRCLTLDFELNMTYPTLVGGAVFATQYSNVTIGGSRFEGNGAEVGGAIFANMGSNMKILSCTFMDNHAAVANSSVKDSHCLDPGVAKLYKDSQLQDFVIELMQSNSSSFDARFSMGGAIALFRSTLLIDSCVFGNHTSITGGAGVLAMKGDSIAIIFNSEIFNSHVLTFGGVLIVDDHSHVTVNNSSIYNSTGQQGGVVAVSFESCLTITNSILINNKASELGGVVLAEQNSSVRVSSSQFINNKAVSGGMLCAVKSMILIEGNKTLFSRNTALHLGGAIDCFQCILTYSGGCIFWYNQAFAGGAVYVEESTLNINGEITLVSNVAITNGGGLYLYRSVLNCKKESTFSVLGNRARDVGGGIYATNSLITVYFNRYSREGSFVRFVSNVAHMGGGASLESASQLRIYKSGDVPCGHYGETSPVTFDSNLADFGNAIFVRDETYFDVCSGSVYSNSISATSTQCFLQVLSPQYTFNHQYELVSVDFVMSNNSQAIRSTTIYGGLLDRCTLSNHAEVLAVRHVPQFAHVDGVMYLKLISNLNDTRGIASAAVRLCFCPFDNKPDCSYAPPEVNVTKGEKFSISLVAVDQVNNTVENVIIYSSLSSPKSGLGYGQLVQRTENTCTNLNFSISSPHSHEQLILYPEGPCRNVSKSQSRISVAFKSCDCPKIGFQPKSNDSEAVTCECECDSRLLPYITSNECNYQTGMLTRNGNFWIAYTDDPALSSGYVIYSHCPLDYCLPNVPVNLNAFNGSDDSQCAKNRCGTLCGACQPGFSLSFGSSLCRQCSTAWYTTFPALVATAFVVGILLVSLLMAFNLTVAIGTLNGLIFYANILGTNGGTIISSSTKVPLVFISWLNLEVGFDLCFIEGMNTYWKTWLQLAFPSYVIVLIIIIIIISNYSMKFSQLLAKRNPVATLATLILLSYTMFLRTTFAILSVAKLNYPDGSQRWVWLHDGTVDYLRGKHIVLFVVAVSILVVGVAYTSVLFFWPWLLHHQNKVVFSWVRCQKLHHFVAPYHAPYNDNYRYWTGLLLFARVALFLVFTLNTSNDPGMNLLAIAVIVGGVLFLRAHVGRIYRNSVIDSIEMICYSNAVVFSSLQLYFLNVGSKEAINLTAYISGVIIMVLFIAVIFYHLCKECDSKCLKRFKQMIVLERNVILDENNENLADYPSEGVIRAAPTFTVVEGPTDCGAHLASNGDSNKQVQKSSRTHSNSNRSGADSASMLSMDSGTFLVDAHR